MPSLPPVALSVNPALATPGIMVDFGTNIVAPSPDLGPFAHCDVGYVIRGSHNDDPDWNEMGLLVPLQARFYMGDGSNGGYMEVSGGGGVVVGLGRWLRIGLVARVGHIWVSASQDMEDSEDWMVDVSKWVLLPVLGFDLTTLGLSEGLDEHVVFMAGGSVDHLGNQWFGYEESSIRNVERARLGYGARFYTRGRSKGGLSLAVFQDWETDLDQRFWFSGLGGELRFQLDRRAGVFFVVSGGYAPFFSQDDKHKVDTWSLGARFEIGSLWVGLGKAVDSWLYGGAVGGRTGPSVVY